MMRDSSNAAAAAGDSACVAVLPTIPRVSRNEAMSVARRRRTGPAQGGCPPSARPRQFRLRHDPARTERGGVPAQPGRAWPHPAHRQAGRDARRQVFVRDDLDGRRVDRRARRPCRATSSRSCPPLAHGKVRFVGEADRDVHRADASRGRGSRRAGRGRVRGAAGAGRCACGARRAERPRPRGMARQPASSRSTTTAASTPEAKNAPVVVTTRGRAGAPGDGADGRQGGARAIGTTAATSSWSTASTQVPHIIRVGLAQFLGIDQGQVRVISPDVGGGFGYKCRAAAGGAVRRLARAEIPQAVPLHRGSSRASGGRRQLAPASLPAHRLRRRARPPAQALDAEVTIDGGAYSAWPFTVALEPGQATGNLPGPYDFRGYRCRTYCVATNKPGFLPYRGVARTGVCFAMELMMDAIARAVGREPWEVRHENLVPAAAMPYNNVTRKHYDSGDYRKALRARAREDRPRRPGARGKDAASPTAACIGIGFATYCEQSAHGTSVFAGVGTCRSFPATTRRRCGSRRTAGSRCASACTRTARAWRRRWRRSRTR